MNIDLTGKVALVTGASRGIGAAIADSLAQSGAKVIGTATSAEQTQKIAERLQEWQGEAKVLNISDAHSIEDLIADIGQIDILVNNAGITRDNLLMRMKDEDWDDIMAINLKSVFRSSKAVLRAMMKARFGRIINITSVIGAMGNPGQANYAAAKGGMVAFSKSLAREVGSRGITVNCVAPGFIDTDMTRAMPAEAVDALVKNIALGRLGNVQDIANTVVFLASDQSAYITGQTIHVNGGMLMP